MKDYKSFIRENRSFFFDRSFRFVGIPIIGIFVYLIILVTMPVKLNQNFSFWPHIIGDIAVAIIISVLVWEGNLLINRIIDGYFDWYTQPRKRLLYQIIFNTIYTVVIMMGIVLLYIKVIDYPLEAAIPFIKITILMGVIVFLLIDAIYIGFHFFRQWEISRFESEELKRQHLQSQYEALKSQVNPHFLFNSLNALTTLIAEDQKLAEEFVQRIASVYRYVLQNKDKELIELEEEVDFIKAFLFLQKIRFAESLKIEINIAPQYLRNYIAPLTLQMLIENAIKHNIISSEKPLLIRVYIEGNDMLVVENNLQKKKIMNNSTGIGLLNIKQRYDLLVKKEIYVMNDNCKFVVKIPLIRDKYNYESINY